MSCGVLQSLDQVNQMGGAGHSKQQKGETGRSADLRTRVGIEMCGWMFVFFVETCSGVIIHFNLAVNKVKSLPLFA